jgi:hypothetical protein
MGESVLVIMWPLRIEDGPNASVMLALRKAPSR